MQNAHLYAKVKAFLRSKKTALVKKTGAHIIKEIIRDVNKTRLS